MTLTLLDYDVAGSPVLSVKSKKASLNEKQLELTMKLDERMSPEMRILMYSVVDGEIIADSLSLELTSCLSHKVSKLMIKENSLNTYSKIFFYGN